jgi:hypothetical protein
LIVCGACILTAILLPSRLTTAGSDHPTTLWLTRSAAAMGIVLALAAAFHPGAIGASVAIAWTFVGLIALMLAPLRPRLWLGAMGVVVLAAMMGRLLLVDGLDGLPREGLPWHGLFLTTWCLAMCVGGAAWLLAAVILSFRSGNQRLHERMPVVAAGASLFMFGASVLHPKAESSSILWIWVGLSGLALGAWPLRKQLRLNWVAGGAAAIDALLWFDVHVIRCEADWTESTAPLLLHPGLWSALVLVGLMIALGWWALKDVRVRKGLSVPAVSVWVASCLLWGATTLEASRVGAAFTGDRTARLATVSIWWAVFAVALILAGFRWTAAPARRAGLGLMGAAALKVVLYDLHGVPPVWRIASFLFLGLLMIAVAIGYSKVTERLLRKPEQDPPRT